MKIKRLKIILLLVGVSIITGQSSFKAGGQIRHRFEMSDKGLTLDSKRTDISYLRTRLNLSFSPEENVQILVQIQDSRILGEELNTLTDGSADRLDFHQAFLKINFKKNISLKLGRMEVNYGPQRFIGAVGWHNIGRSFDGVILAYTNPKMTIDVFNFKEVEFLLPEEKFDKNVRGFYGSFQLIPNGKTQAFFIQDGNRNTYGGYAQGQLAGFGYELEVALQGGNNGGEIPVNYKGLMWGANFSYGISENVLSAGVDFISGDDTTTIEMESFHTLYATNHKYYGFMDYFLNLPVHTLGEGLFDFHVKATLAPLKGIKPKLAYHSFKNATRTGTFGQEIDLTLQYKYNSAVSFVGGYSVFINGDLKGDKNRTATWTYLMTIVNF